MIEFYILDRFIRRKHIEENIIAYDGFLEQYY